MSWRPAKWLTWAMRQEAFETLSPVARKVLAGLLIHVGEGGRSMPGQQRLQDALGMSERSIRKGLRELSDQGRGGLVRCEILPGQPSEYFLRPMDPLPGSRGLPDWEDTETPCPSAGGKAEDPLPSGSPCPTAGPCSSAGGTPPAPRQGVAPDPLLNPLLPGSEPPAQGQDEVFKREEKETAVSQSSSSCTSPEGAGSGDCVTDDGQGPAGPAVKEETKEKSPPPELDWLAGIVAPSPEPEPVADPEPAEEAPGEPWAKVTRALEVREVLPSVATGAASRLLDMADQDVDLALQVVETLGGRAAKRAKSNPGALLASMVRDGDARQLIQRLKVGLGSPGNNGSPGAGSSKTHPTQSWEAKDPSVEEDNRAHVEKRHQQRDRIAASRQLLADDPDRWAAIWEEVGAVEWNFPSRPRRDDIDDPENNDVAHELIGARMESGS